MSDGSATPRSRPWPSGLQAGSSLAIVPLALAVGCLLVVPLGLRAANRLHPAPNLQPSYLPALSGPRERQPFDAGRIDDLARMNPGIVVIGDSMAGSRIDPALLDRLTGQRTAPLLYAGSGPAWWYLALKNWVIASGIRPRAVVVFFRDTNLTNVLFRIDATWSLDTAAREREDDLNAVVARRRGSPFYRVRDGVERVYQAEQARRWIEPAVNEWPARALVPYRRPRAAFLERLNERFGLSHLRPMDAADMQATEDREADFDAFVDKSGLPLMLRDARQAGLTLVLVRVQRRPAGGQPPHQSAALQRYVARLETYVESNGGVFMDDTGDPAQTLDLYEDGDHLSREGRRRYTELFAPRLRQRVPVIFHSLDFVIFFILVTAVYWRLPHRGQNVLLLVASYFFYGYVHPWFLILIASSTVIDYLSARGMERWPERRRAFMATSIVTNFGMLGFFKYFNFFVDNLHTVLEAAGLQVSLPVLRVILPVGISFYTFQAMSYTVDVFRGELRARRSLLDVAVFISFFPHLVAGPIQRASYLLPQVEERRRFALAKATSGFYLMVWGFFKKLVIADNVGIIANKVFALSDPTFEILWAGVFAFAVQIYADFSAYTDIARGSSRWLGFELTENFDHPYLARNPADFWRRWNISLSSWFRDYVYIPLGGSRASEWIWARNVMITFLLSGLWHGASWNYVLWGLYHGVLLVITRAHQILKPAPPSTVAKASVDESPLRPPAPLRGYGEAGSVGVAARTVLQTAGMFALTLFGWLLFRETELSAIVRDLRLAPWNSSPFERQAGLYLFLLAFGYSIPLWTQSIWVELHRGLTQPEEDRRGLGVAVLKAIACGAAFAAILVLRSRTSLDFIYFQF